MKRVKRLVIAAVCMMLLVAAVPAVKADAAVTKAGVYGGCFAKSGDGAIKVTISGSKITMKGKAYYAKKESTWYDEDTVLKSSKRVFKLDKKVKYYNNKDKKIKRAAVKKHIKKYSGKGLRHGLRLTVKNKKVVAVRIW